MNAGPGAVAQAFVHESHHTKIPTLTGWWGVDPEEQFLMKDDFVPAQGADAYQISTPNILSMVALYASLELIDAVAISKIWSKNQDLSSFLISALQALSRRLPDDSFRILSPTDPERRGAQVSVSFGSRGNEIFNALIEKGVVVDWREPDVIRMAPTALYNTYVEIYEVVHMIERKLLGSE